MMVTKTHFPYSFPVALSVAETWSCPFSSISFLGWLLLSCRFLSVCDLLVSDFCYCFLLKQGFISITRESLLCLFIYSSNILFQRETLLKKLLKCFNRFWRKEVMKCQVIAIKLNSFVNLFSHLVERIRKRTHPSLSRFYWNGYLFSTVLEKAMAPHSSALAWKIPWTEEPGSLQSMGSLRVGHDWATSLSLFTFMHWRRKWQPTPVFLPGEFQGQRSLVGCRVWGRTESDTTEVT